ncbi:collagen alpha-1(I) chain-like [Nycticebus coucang]|uniref:collagen alpha-1(I) chain-like n=1 Tax=Nycticebus coucang TaxID=9470 RepID=UPI00234C04C6|nr:collagen alpha-1(I) chain-like [Nycticebus coucang]
MRPAGEGGSEGGAPAAGSPGQHPQLPEGTWRGRPGPSQRGPPTAQPAARTASLPRPGCAGHLGPTRFSGAVTSARGGPDGLSPAGGRQAGRASVVFAQEHGSVTQAGVQWHDHSSQQPQAPGLDIQDGHLDLQTVPEPCTRLLHVVTTSPPRENILFPTPVPVLTRSTRSDR